MGTKRIEWIGVMSPQADDRVVYRKIMRKYTPQQEAALDLVSSNIKTLIRTDMKTARRLRAQDGFTRDYLFGHRRGTYVQEMDDEDVRYLFSDDYPDGHEFKNLDDPAHEGRVPIVPWAYVNRMIYDILKEAATGPIVHVTSQGVYKTPEQLVAEYERRFDVEKAEHFRKQSRG